MFSNTNNTVTDHNRGTSAFDSELKSRVGMHLVLITQQGAMYELWLPADTQGFCEFTGVDDCVYPYLRIECSDGDLTAVSQHSSSISFFTPQAEKLRRAKLESSFLYSISTLAGNDILFTEPFNDETNVFHNYYVEKNRFISIGRSADNDICCRSKLISGSHARLLWDGSAWSLIDETSRNGTYVNGKRVSHSTLFCGDTIFIMGVKIIAGYGFISVSDGNDAVRISSPHIRRIRSEADIRYSVPGGAEIEDDLYNRLPRERISMRKEPIYIDNPPASLRGGQVPFLLRMGSPAAMGTRALITGNYFMAATSMIFPFLTQGYTEKERKEYEAQRIKTYSAYLDAKRSEIEDECAREISALAQIHPSINAVASWAQSGRRLWERRNIDDDFLEVRVGTGDRPMLVELDAPDEHFEVEVDSLEEKMRALVNEKRLLKDAPVTTSLIEHNVLGLVGEQKYIRRFIYRMIVQLAATHSYDEVKIVMLLNEADLKYFDSFRFLPHMWDDDRSIRFAATDTAGTIRISSYLAESIGKEFERPRELKKQMADRPYYVIFALDKKLFDAAEVLKDILRADGNVGVSVIAGMKELPKECSKVFTLTDSVCSTTYMNDPERFAEKFMPDPLDRPIVEAALHRIVNTRMSTVRSSYILPKTVTFLELFDAGKVEHLNILRRWSTNNPIQSLAVPVGIGTDGDIFTLDLHQKSQGPHGLVAGTTGSGKSEFLITYILSLAVSFSPDEVAFVLIDYKGGGLTGAFHDELHGLHLPHLVATITNLDGAAIGRSLISIKAELKRRQKALNDARSILNTGTMDIYDYQRYYRAGKLKEPMPHLFIISDEFAELKTQQPEFLNELISAARIGRSLGIHLILATQKPAGVVNDQIVSNTRFRVCLRVADRQDSMDMLKRPEASTLKDTGRFYLQVGNNDFFGLGQSAWCGAPYEPQNEVVKQLDESIAVLDSTGQSVITVRPQKKKKSSDVKQVVAVVEYLSQIARQENIRPKSLWLDTLPETIDLEREQSAFPPEKRCSICVGRVDDPENQSAHPLCIDLLHSGNILAVGSSGSGKSTLLTSLLYGIVKTHSPEEICFYTLEFSGRALSAFASAPHCGASFNDDSEADIERLFDFIDSTLAKRRRLFAEAGVPDYESYLTVRPMPLMLVVIDNITGMNAFSKGADILQELHRYLRDGLNCGIRFVITATQLNHVNPRAKAEIKYRLAYQLKDKFEFGEAMNAKVAYVPPEIRGRGLCIYDSRPLEFHTAKFRPELAPLEAGLALRREVDAVAAKYKGRTGAEKVPFIREKQTYGEFMADIPAGRIPLGYSLTSAKKISIPLKQAFCLSLYFGNPVGAAPILGNLITAAERERADYFVVPSLSGSLFEGKNSLLGSVRGKVQSFSASEAGSKALWGAIASVIESRKLIRNRYCEQHGLEPSDTNSLAAASEAICAETRPLLIVLERFAEFCTNTDEMFPRLMPTFMQIARYYNIFFLGCFYPGDSTGITVKPVFTAFNPDKNVLLFGGQTDKQELVRFDFKSAVKEPLAKYSRGVMNYRGVNHAIVMPCGDNVQVQTAGDDASIFD